MTNEKDYKLASDFKALPGEANFPPPIEQEVVGGVHIAPEFITRQGKLFLNIVWPNGLPRHETHRTVRFPHGLMRFGETVHECAERIIEAQLGMNVEAVRVLHIDSYVDDVGHWHIEPCVLVEVSGEPKLPAEAGEVIYFEGGNVPEDGFWSKQGFRELLDNSISIFEG